MPNPWPDPRDPEPVKVRDFLVYLAAAVIGAGFIVNITRGLIGQGFNW